MPLSVSATAPVSAPIEPTANMKTIKKEKTKSKVWGVLLRGKSKRNKVEAQNEQGTTAVPIKRAPRLADPTEY